MIKTNIEEIYNTNEEPDKIDFKDERNKLYFSRRKELKTMIKSINTYISNSSQSFFLALYLMDTVFTSSNLETIFFQHFKSWDYLIPMKDIQLNNYALLSVACLIISYKYSENDPNLQSMASFVKLLYHFSKKNFIFSAKDLAMAEVIAIKLLKYKLNYFTIYHFFIFFFTHGIIFKKTFKNSELFGKISEKKMLEKIYVQSREILDWIVDSEEYFNYYYGKDNHIIVVEIISWTIEHILRLKIPKNENIFKLIYNIKINEKKHLKIYELINRLYSSKKPKNESLNEEKQTNKPHSKIIDAYNKKNIDTYNNKNIDTYNNKNIDTYNNKNINKNENLNNKNDSNHTNSNTNTSSFVALTETNTERSNYNYNFNSKQSTNGGNVTSSYNTFYNHLASYEGGPFIFTDSLSNEFDQFSNNYSYQYTVPNKPVSVLRPKANIKPKKLGLKNRGFYNSNKNITTPYEINPINFSNSSLVQTIPPKNEILNKTEKEPTDNLKKRSNLIGNENIPVINFDDYYSKRIILDDSAKIKKKSLSCCKKPNSAIANNTDYDYPIKASYIETNNNLFDIINENELQIEEKINQPKIFNNKININNYLYSISPNASLPGNHTNKKKEKKTLFKKYQQSSNEYNSKKKHKHKIAPASKIMSVEELSNRSKNLYTVTKINQPVENEPRDNIKRSINKLKKKIESNNLRNNKNKINKHNTIIINNNIHINTYIDNGNSVNTNKPIKNSKIFIFNRANDKNPQEVFTLPNKQSNKNAKNQKLFYDFRNNNNQTIVAKRNTITNEWNNLNEFNYLNFQF